SMRRLDEKTDAERVEFVIGNYRAGGLAVVGVRDVLAALSYGQVDEVLMDALAANLRIDDQESKATQESYVAATGAGAMPDRQLQGIADEIVRQAKRTGANLRFI